ncbi:ABC transporter permease [Hymenobacter sp. HSC-4F20]|uniref:ABC transporter permease n=1 Tax=Hymenobacter sp. HSC-4F20 TaxID=2864135 RepID=UPI001C72C3AE|nr:ABC transporter permease [Hymenobacter sp. HSC-4F20]MBX0291063.1 ABC transporter permease [Hymenobacter sp. HSC-4F20]
MSRSRVSPGLAGIAGGWLLLIILAAWATPTTVPIPDLARAGYPPFQAPHWLGTDPQGLDVGWSLLQGSRTVVLISVPAALLTLLLGTGLGSAAGFWGNRLALTRARAVAGAGLLTSGLLFWAQLAAFPILGALFLLLAGSLEALLRRTRWGRQPHFLPLDAALSACSALLDSIPLLLLVVAVASVQRPSVSGIVSLLALTCWTTPARLMRAATLQVAVQPYLEAARMTGLTDLQLLRRHIWPNTWQVAAVRFPMTVAALISLETTLAFLGIGLAPETPSWGRILSAVRQAPTAWWLVVWPGLALIVTLLSLHVLSRWLQDRMDVTNTSNNLLT